MTHAAEGLLQAYLDGEVDGSAVAELDDHLRRCAPCAAELDRLRAIGEQVGGALAVLDVPRTAEQAEQAWWRTRAAARKPAARRFFQGALGRAAVLLVAAAGVVSAALPGSPLREVLTEWLGGGEPEATSDVEAPPPVTEPETPAVEVPEAPRTELAVLPDDGRIVVRIWSATPNALIRVNFVPGERVSVEAGREGSEVRLRSGPGRLEVYDLGAGEATVELPYSISLASIEVDGRQYLYQVDGQLRTPGPVIERTSQSIVFRVP